MDNDYWNWKHNSALKGYQGLHLFIYVYPTWESFLLQMRDWVIIADLNDEENEEHLRKLYNRLLLRYYNHYFRYSEISDINEEVAKFVEAWVRYKHILTNLSADDALWDLEQIDIGNTENMRNPELSETQLSYENTKNRDAKFYVETQVGSILKVEFYPTLISRFRKLFMNHTNNKTLKQLKEDVEKLNDRGSSPRIREVNND